MTNNEPNNNVDENGSVENVEIEPIVSMDILREFKRHPFVEKVILKHFNKIGKKGISNLVEKIFQNSIDIHVNDINKNKTFLRRNLGKFDKDTRKLKIQEIKDIRRKFFIEIAKAGQKISQYDETKHSKIKITKKGDYYILNKYTLYKKVRELICEEGDNAQLKYDFEKPDMKVKPPTNTQTLQRCNIQVLSSGIMFDYPIEYEYSCPECNHQMTKKAYETASTKTKISCPGTKIETNPNTDETKAKICRARLCPDDEISDTKNCYYYEIAYDDEVGKKKSVGAICFDRIEPGFYESAIFKIKNPKKMELYHIADIKDLESNKYTVPEKVPDENFIFTLQKSFDKYIKKQTGMNVYGLTVIKCALIVQKVFGDVMNELSANIQIVGDASTGKSTVLKYYSFLLNSNFNLSTNAVSISIPALRGTRESINLMGTDVRIITMGYLGTYSTIHIDEIAEDPILQQNLKVFLLEDNYSYNKAGANENSNKRTAQVNISENLNHNHVGQYIGGIRKAYKDDTLKIGTEEKTPWDENEDFYQPLHRYISTNPYLYKVIKDKRDEYTNKKVWWIDGLDYALHQRFPFYFYLTNEKENKELLEIVKENVSTNVVSETLELIKVLRSEDITSHFLSLKEYLHSPNDPEAFLKVDKILDQYDISKDARTRKFFYNLLKAIRISNSRLTIEETDYDMLKWFIETTNCKIDVSDIGTINIEGPPDTKELKQKAEEIEDATLSVHSSFDNDVSDFDTPNTFN